MLQIAIAKRDFFTGASHARQQSVVKGNSYPVISKNKDQIWIKTSNGSFGWVDAKDFTIVNSIGGKIKA